MVDRGEAGDCRGEPWAWVRPSEIIHKHGITSGKLYGWRQQLTRRVDEQRRRGPARLFRHSSKSSWLQSESVAGLRRNQWLEWIGISGCFAPDSAHTTAYWLMFAVRDAIPKPQSLASAEFTTLRRRLIKVATHVIETATRVRFAFCRATIRMRTLRLSDVNDGSLAGSGPSRKRNKTKLRKHPKRIEHAPMLCDLAFSVEPKDM